MTDIPINYGIIGISWGEGVQNKKSSMGGGWIFSGNAQDVFMVIPP